MSHDFVFWEFHQKWVTGRPCVHCINLRELGWGLEGPVRLIELGKGRGCNVRKVAVEDRGHRPVCDVKVIDR